MLQDKWHASFLELTILRVIYNMLPYLSESWSTSIFLFAFSTVFPDQATEAGTLQLKAPISILTSESQ